MSEAVEMQRCEACDADVPLETATLMEECWFCPACVAKFLETFRACQHEWEPHVDSMGDPGWYCCRCAGFVNAEDFPALFPGVPLPEAPSDQADPR